ncbi:hypothetical protein EGR52_12355 [bacterium]|nr:hypothetical protein [bacterium]
MWTSINKKIYVLLSVILIIGISLGIVFLIMQDEAYKEILYLNINEYIQGNNNINNILIHLVSLSTIFLMSLFVIGIPLVIFFLFYNGFSIGFTICSLTNIFGIKGLLYGIIYILISKGIFILFLIIFSVTLFKIIKELIDVFINKSNNKDMLVLLIKKALLCVLIIFINDIILYFGGVKLINLFNFIIN